MTRFNFLLGCIHVFSTSPTSTRISTTCTRISTTCTVATSSRTFITAGLIKRVTMQPGARTDYRIAVLIFPNPREIVLI